MVVVTGVYSGEGGGVRREDCKLSLVNMLAVKELQCAFCKAPYPTRRGRGGAVRKCQKVMF